MPIKPTWNERVKKGQDELKKTAVEKSEVLGIISECLKKKGIDGEALLIEPASKNIDYKKIMDTYKTNGEGHIVWVQFVNSGHVAVVGAGKDIGFPKNEIKGTWSILSKLSDVEWDTKNLIIVPVKGLDNKSNGLKNVKNILKCRNGVEHCIGEYLIEKKVPILNYYSHKNYSVKFWEKCEERNYRNQ